MRELPEMAYLLQQPLIVDTTETEQLPGATASSIGEMVAGTLGRAAEKA
jgi:hypothetical protein